MRIAILSDIHSNRQALDAAVRTLQSKDVDTFWSTGDFINYGANPAYVMDWVSQHVEVAVLGNHDALIIEQESPDFFNQYARDTVTYTREQLSQTHLDFIKQLHLATESHNLRLVHAAPDNPRNWEYVMSPGQARRLFASFTEPICFFGHTHVQGIFDENGNWIKEEKVQLEHNMRYLINPGSVGQPRDRDSRWAAAIYDTNAHTIELLRGEYDIESAAEEIYNAGLPPFLGNRLFQGR